MAAAWADVLNAHRDYLRYSDILCTIIEVHVTACRLASFKTSYHAHRDAFVRLMEVRLGLSAHDASEVFLSVLYHAAGSMWKLPLQSGYAGGYENSRNPI